MNEIIVKTEKLSKHYKKFKALDNANMTVFKGDIYGLIGRNGAGKTTMMKILTGLTESTSGSFELFGKQGNDAARERKRIGCLIENPAFFGNMTAFENLKYYCLQKGITDLKQIDEALEFVQLSDAKNKKFKKFSLGMKQRLGIAFALLDNPDLIILDEPINGLDPIGISRLREIFRKLNAERGITFIISSHILSELYATSNRFLFIDKGQVLKEVTKEQLDKECSRCIVIKTEDTKLTSIVLESSLKISNFKVTETDEIRVYDETVDPSSINKNLIANDINVKAIYESGVSLEDYFKQLVGEEIK